MLNCIFIISVYISTVLCYSAGSELFPEEGKVFYADLMTDDNYGRHYVQLNIDTSNMKLWVSTTQSEIGVVTVGCTSCSVPSKYDYTKSRSTATLNRDQREHCGGRGPYCLK